MNAAEHVNSVDFAYTLASSITLVRREFPVVFANLNPWGDDPETCIWFEHGTVDLAFHFPGWTPDLQCRSIINAVVCNRESKRVCTFVVGGFNTWNDVRG